MNQTRDIIILLDVTISMRGEGGGDVADIWQDVQNNVIAQIEALPDGTSFAIIPFDSGPRLSSIWPNPPQSLEEQIDLYPASPSTREHAINHVSNMEPDGLGTWICESMEYALNQANRWNAAHPTTNRTQNLYLYTDGDEEGAMCRGDFARLMVDYFDAATGEAPYLKMVYIDIRDNLTPEDQQIIDEHPDIERKTFLPDNIQISSDAVFIGSLSRGRSATSDFFSVVRGEVTSTDGQPRLARLEFHPEQYGIQVNETVPLAEQMSITFDAGDASLQPGQYSGYVRFIAEGDDFVIFPDTVDVFFTWEPEPTPTPDPTPTPEPPPPTVTPDPTPTTEPSPTPTPIPEPTPTPTPNPGIYIERVDQEILGTIEAGSDQVLEEKRTLQVTFDADAVANNSNVEIQAVGDDVPGIGTILLVHPRTGQENQRLTLTPNGESQAEVEIKFTIPAPERGRLRPGDETRTVRIMSSSQQATISTPDQNGGEDGTLQYAYTISHPLGTAFIVMIIAGLLTILAILWAALQPRFPRLAELQSSAGDSLRLQPASQRGMFRRIRPRELSIGGFNADLDIGSDQILGYVTPRRTSFSLGGKQTWFVPASTAEATPVSVNMAPVTEARQLFTDDLIQGVGRTITYIE